MASTTRLLVTDVICNWLRSKGLPMPSPSPESTPCKVQQSLRLMCTELYSKHEATFDDMLGRFHISPDTIRTNLEAIMSLLFSDTVNWGRIATLFSFCAVLSERCIEKEMPQLVPKIIDWTVSYCDSHLQPWIDENGGWAGFVTFYNPDGQKEIAWPSLRDIGGYAAGAVGMFALALLVSPRV